MPSLRQRKKQYHHWLNRQRYSLLQKLPWETLGQNVELKERVRILPSHLPPGEALLLLRRYHEHLRRVKIYNTITYVQNWAVATGGSGTTTLQSAAAGSSLTNPSSIFVFAWVFGLVSVSSITDTAGNMYAQDNTAANSNVQSFLWRADNTHTTASNKITVNLSAGAFLTFTASEFTGVASGTYSSVDDGHNEGSGQAANFVASTGTFSTTNANDLLIATFSTGGMNALAGPPSGFTNINKSTSGGTFEDGSADYEIVSTTQTNINPTWGAATSGNQQWAAIGQSYKASSAAAVAQPWTWVPILGPILGQ